MCIRCRQVTHSSAPKLFLWELTTTIMRLDEIDGSGDQRLAVHATLVPIVTLKTKPMIPQTTEGLGKA